VGVVGVGVGVGFLIAVGSAVDAANASFTHDGYASSWSTARVRQDIGVTSLVVGSALLATGAVRLALLRRQAARTGTLFVVSLGPGLLALGGAF
jgi:hypothetical protein